MDIAELEELATLLRKYLYTHAYRGSVVSSCRTLLHAVNVTLGKKARRPHFTLR